MPISETSEADTYFEMQCNQIFIGMVTMQYQVITDMVCVFFFYYFSLT